MGKKCSRCGVVKPLDGFNKRVSSKDGHRPNCRECQALDKQIYLSNLSSQKLAEKRAYTRKWKRENREAVRAYKADRRAAKIMRAAKWGNKDVIRSFYIAAKYLEELTQQEWHVDHVIPLQGKLVSGLHIESNLQLLTKEENLSKHNKFEV